MLSPTSFIIFLAPLIWKLKEFKLGININHNNEPLLAFVDDLVLFDSSTNRIIQSFKVLKKFSKDFYFDINANKSVYAWRQGSPAYNLKYKGKPLEYLTDTEYYKYLGLYLNL